ARRGRVRGGGGPSSGRIEKPEKSPPVVTSRRGGGVAGDRTGGSQADGLETMRLDTLFGQEPTDRLRPKLAETKIVHRRARAVSVALQLDDEGRILLQAPNNVAQCGAR